MLPEAGAAQVAASAATLAAPGALAARGTAGITTAGIASSMGDAPKRCEQGEPRQESCRSWQTIQIRPALEV